MSSAKKHKSESLNRETNFMLDDCDDLSVVLENLKEKLNKCTFSYINEEDDLSNDVVSIMLQVTQQIYTRNAATVRSNNTEALKIIKSNLEVAISLIGILDDLIEKIMRNGIVPFNQISSIPVNMGHIIFLTFEHCKSSQRMYSSLHNSISEILDLFRKAQELHVRFLSFLDTHLIFNFLNQTDVDAYEEVLNILLKISKILLGVNMKSMADNWKAFITLIQKMCEKNFTFFNLSPAIQLLTEEINVSLSTITEMEIIDSKTSTQQLKVTGFLLKVVLKLLENTWSLTESYDSILKFCIMIYRHGSSVHNKNISDEVINSVGTLFQLCRDSVGTLLLCDSTFLKNFCILKERNHFSVQESFGLLMFGNDLLKDLPRLLKCHPEIADDVQIVPLLQLFFSLMKNCYNGYFNDYNSCFYQELTTNICVVLLMFPNYFSEAEEILLNCTIGNNVWTFVIAMDIWCLTLRHSLEAVCRSTLTFLIRKIEELKLGVVSPSPVIIRLKILTQRIFKVLSLHVKNEELSKYSPTSNIFVWKIISLRNVPLSHRYYVEFITSDVFEKSDVIKADDCSLIDMISLLESVDVLSYTNFNDLEISTSKLIPFILLLWSFDIQDLSPNIFFNKYFIYKLMKITVAVTGELIPENLLQILSQVKFLRDGSLNKLFICALLETVSKRNFTDYPEKATLFLLISDLFQILLADKCSVVVTKALKSFQKIYDSTKYEEVVQKVMVSNNNKMVTDYMQKRAVDDRYSDKHFEKFQCVNVQHHCFEWTTNTCQPLSKKIKFENEETEIDVIIRNLKSDTEKLISMKSKGCLNSKQVTDLRSTLSKLKTLID